MEIKPDSTLALLTDIVRCLDDKKAEDLRVLKVGAQSSITDYLVLATGTSEPHLRALRVELEKAIDQRKAPIAGMDSGEPGSGWTVVDAYQVMVHLFTAEKREQYRLENLWKDAQDVSLQRLLQPDGEAKAAPAAIPTMAAKPAADASAGGNALAAPEATGAPASPVAAAVESAPIDQTVPTPANRADALKAKPRARPAGKAKSGAKSKTNATTLAASGGPKKPRTTPSSGRTSNGVGAKSKTASALKTPLAMAAPARTSKKASSATRASAAAKKPQSGAKAATAAKKSSSPIKTTVHSVTKAKARAATQTTAGAPIKAPTKARASALTQAAAKASASAGTTPKLFGRIPAKAKSEANAKGPVKAKR